MATRPSFGIFGGPPKASSGSIGSLFSNAVKSAAAATPQTTQAQTQAQTQPTSTNKAAQAPQYSAPTSNGINTNIIDAILSNNIDRGDPNIVTGTQLKAAASKGQIDPSLGNLSSINASVAKGAAALGIIKNSNANNFTGVTNFTYSGDLLGAAKSLGINTDSYMKFASGPMGSKILELDKNALYSEINNRANQLGIYSVTERVPGTPADNAEHITTFYQNSNGVLQPLKNADGSVASSKFRASSYTTDDGFFGGLVSGIKGITTELSPIISLALPNLGLTIGQQIALNAASSLAQGVSPENIARGAVGALVANQFGPIKPGQTAGVSVIDDFNKAIQAIGSPELQSAIFNGVRQGVYATATQQDIAKNMAAGAIAGAIATNIQNKYNDPALASSAGEFIQAKIAGKSDIEAAAAAFSGLASEEERKKAKQIVDEELAGLPLGQVEALFPKEDTLQVDVAGGAGTEKEKELPPTETVAQRDPQDIDGLSLIRRVRTGQNALQVDVAGGAGFDRGGELPTQESVAQREPEEEVSEPQRLITESEQDTPQEETEAQRPISSTVLLGLLGGDGRFQTTQRTQRAPDERQAASMQALSQALSIGDPGDALFGSGLGRRRNVWNVESLRLKDELGG